MKQYPVIFTEEAEQHLVALEVYLAERFYSANAERFVRRLIEACNALGRMPQVGTIRDEKIPGMRVVGFERRVAIYFVFEAEKVVILGLHYGGRS